LTHRPDLRTGPGRGGGQFGFVAADGGHGLADDEEVLA